MISFGMPNQGTPTPEQKIEMYENVFHQINICLMCCDNDKLGNLIQRIDNWSYAHRLGNGRPTEEEQQAMVDRAFWKLLETK